MSNDDQVTSEVETSTYTSLDSDADVQAEPENVQLTGTPEATSDSEQGEVLSAYAVKQINEISSIDNENQVQERIAKLEKSGRARDLEAAGILREKFGGTPVAMPEEEKLNKLLDSRLQQLGITAEDIKSQKEAREESARLRTIKGVLEDRKLPGDPDKIMRNKEFVLAFHADKYKDLSTEEKTELALNKVLKGVTPALSATGGPPKMGAEPDNIPLADRSWKGLSVDDLSR